MKFKLLSLISCAVLFLYGVDSAFAQTRPVKGTILEEDGQPAIGAYVVVEGIANKGAITDLDGNFTLEGVPATAKTLVITHMGFLEEKVAIAPIIKVTLKQDSEVLESAVVSGMT